MSIIRPLDRTYNPIALYLFDNNLRDTSGNGLHMTSVGARPPAFGRHDIEGPACLWAYDDVGVAAPIDPLTQITGALTVQLLLTFGAFRTITHTLFSHHGVGGTGWNELYRVQIVATSREMNYLHRVPGGAVRQFSARTGIHAAGSTNHFALVRTFSGTTCNLAMYINGVLVDTGSTGTSSIPGDGAEGQLHVGKPRAGTESLFGISSLKINDIALSASAIAAEAERCLGRVYEGL